MHYTKCFASVNIPSSYWAAKTCVVAGWGGISLSNCYALGSHFPFLSSVRLSYVSFCICSFPFVWGKMQGFQYLGSLHSTFLVTPIEVHETVIYRKYIK